MTPRQQERQAREKRPRRCTWCGKPCDGSWRRHLYGLLAEPRCSQKCALNPVADIETLRTLEYMGAYVFAAKAAGLAPVTFSDVVFAAKTDTDSLQKHVRAIRRTTREGR